MHFDADCTLLLTESCEIPVQKTQQFAANRLCAEKSRKASMMQLDINCVNRWIAGSKQVQHPGSICITCPGCSMRGSFSTKRRMYDDYRDTLSCSAQCPACNTQVHFWITDMVSKDREDMEESPALYMMPGSTAALDMSDLPENVPSNVVQHCSSTVDVYSSGNLTASTILAKSTLEAIFEEHLPLGNSRTSLAKLIQDSTQSIGLEQPLLALSKSLRPEGNLHKLFSSSQFASKESAEAMMKLLNLLINYLYVIPNDFADLDNQFAELSRITNLNDKDLDAPSQRENAA